jgi:hypothetical protein
VSVKRVLREACALIQRAHVAPPPGTPLLAVDARGNRCEPLSPAAVAWTTCGALYVADPAVRRPDLPDTHGRDAWDAWLLLTEAAKQQGHGNVVEADRAGLSAAVKCFWRAGQLAEPEGHARRRGGRAGAGSTPKGAA